MIDPSLVYYSSLPWSAASGGELFEGVRKDDLHIRFGVRVLRYSSNGGSGIYRSEPVIDRVTALAHGDRLGIAPDRLPGSKHSTWSEADEVALPTANGWLTRISGSLRVQRVQSTGRMVYQMVVRARCRCAAEIEVTRDRWVRGKSVALTCGGPTCARSKRIESLLGRRERRMARSCAA